jgi:biotin carboxyl carrier protein
MSGPTANLNTTPNNPEQLDQAVRTTTVRGWIALGLAVFAVAAAVVWAFVATIPRQVDATAVISDPDSIRTVVAGGTGSVTVDASAGDRVEAGEEVGRLEKFGGGSRAIVATADGRVSDVLVTQGQGIEPTDPVLSVSTTRSPAHPRLVTFLPESEAVLYREGAEVKVELENPAGAPAVAPARVSYVSEVPSPATAIAVAVHSAGLARQLSKDADEALYRVVMRIEGGLGDEAVGGQVAKVTNTYDRQHPIDLLFGDISG